MSPEFLDVTLTILSVSYVSSQQSYEVLIDVISIQ